MRLRLFLICLALVIFSLAGGLGLRYVQAVWTEPGAAPPDGNVAPPINEGGAAQTKVGDLTIGGNFTVNGISGGNVCHLVGGTWYNCPGLLVTPNLQQVTDEGNMTTNALAIDSDANETTTVGGNLTVSGTTQLGLTGLNGSNLYFNQTINSYFYIDSKKGVQLRLDSDEATNPDNSVFAINNGVNAQILTLDEAGNLMIAGAATITGNATVAGQNVCLADGTNCPGALGNYVWLQGATPGVQQTGNFNVSGTGLIGNDLSVANKIYIGGTEMNFTNVGNFFVNGNGDVQVRIDADNNGSNLFKINNGANTTVMTVSEGGNVSALGCFGPVYVNQTDGSYTGELNDPTKVNVGYDNANALCAAKVAGSHVCTTSEILETIKCNLTGLPINGQVWISNGPPGYTARANDCVGWTSASPDSVDHTTIVYGAIWAFDPNGGVGWVTTCNQTLKFACCK